MVSAQNPGYFPFPGLAFLSVAVLVPADLPVLVEVLVLVLGMSVSPCGD
jgi:hypothetical protein